ncbi:mavicyanin-like [Panicum miliaceum]|uniref:Mavicyanin-like n=1 Tax=Panicum miliaceum TaxID=4540 RepID=A0A3L6T7U3_PANMI|nr:mavicyanin-like [Panicum miliaceum]
MSFKYAASHDVTEVTKAGYDACSGANPVKSYTGGATTVKLAAPGKRYFICSVPGHCAAGMKLEVTVAAAAVTAPAPARSKPRHQRSVAPTPAPAMAAPEPSSVPSTDGLPTVSTPTAAPAPKSSGAASIGVLGAKAGMTLAVGMALALAI